MSDLSALLAELARLPRMSSSVLSEIELTAPHILAHLDVVLSHHPEFRGDLLPFGPAEFRRTLRGVAEGFITVLREGDAPRLVAWSSHVLAAQRSLGLTLDQVRIEIECTLLLLDDHLSPEAAAATRPLLTGIVRHIDELEGHGASEAA